jgi:hypothetical protein
MFATPGEKPLLVMLRPLFKGEYGVSCPYTTKTVVDIDDSVAFVAAPVLVWLFPACGYKWSHADDPHARKAGHVNGKDLWIAPGQQSPD